MASVRKKRKQQENREPDRTAADYYRLKTDAVEDLVHADESNSPKVSEEELRKYRSRGKWKLPMWLKVVLMKAWFYGAVCFFFLWGLGMYIADQLDLFVITAIALGMVTDLLINTALRYFSEREGSNDTWMMVPLRGVPGFFLNILYAFVVLALVATLYNVINITILAVTKQTDAVPLGVEPILFGLFYMGIDMGLLALKHLLVNIISDAKKKAGKA